MSEQEHKSQAVLKQERVIREFIDLKEWDLEDKPDFIMTWPNGGRSDFWFKEMKMYCHYDGKVIPLLWDGDNEIMDHWYDQRWVSLSDELVEAYKSWLVDTIVLG